MAEIQPWVIYMMLLVQIGILICMFFMIQFINDGFATLAQFCQNAKMFGGG